MMPFTWAGFRRGAVAGLPLSVSGFIWGIAFGVLAAQAGLLAAETALMSATIFSGTAQMVAVAVWDGPLTGILLAVLAVNARYVMLGAALAPVYAGLRGWRPYASLAVLTDGGWALAIRRHAAGENDGAFLAGAGATNLILWTCGSTIGVLGGAALPDPRVFGLDVLLPVFCAGVLGALVRRRVQLAPFAAGVVAAFLAAPFGITAAVVAGGLAAGAVGAARMHDAP